jgi:hypothetical protein
MDTAGVRLRRLFVFNGTAFPEVEEEMKTAIAIASAMGLALTAGLGCSTSAPKGGGAPSDQSFSISVPNSETDVKQGELQTVTLSLHRGDFFKQDVKLELKSTEGITVEPSSVTVKASDKPDTQIQITATKNAALGESRVYVKAIPDSGETTSADFDVKVIAQ